MHIQKKKKKKKKKRKETNQKNKHIKEATRCHKKKGM